MIYSLHSRAELHAGGVQGLKRKLLHVFASQRAAWWTLHARLREKELN